MKFLLIITNKCAIIKKNKREVRAVASKASAVDVISVCSAKGEIRPLRLQLMDESHQQIRINIEQVVSVKEIPHVGAEAQIFLCRACVWEKEWLFELKYTIRSHTWCLLRKVSG